MASSYSSSPSIFFAPSRKSRRTRTIRFFDDAASSDDPGASEPPAPAPASPEDVLDADLRLATELQREENLLFLRDAAARRAHRIQAGRNRTGRSCAHGFGLATRGVACRADRDLIAEQEREAERRQAVEVELHADDAGSGGGESPERRTPKNATATDDDEHDEQSSACSSVNSEEASSSTSPRRGRRTRVRQASSGVAAMAHDVRLPPPLGYRLASGLTDNNPRLDEDDDDDKDDDEDQRSDNGAEEQEEEQQPSKSSPLRSIDNQDCHHSPSTPTKGAMPTSPPSILKNPLNRSPPSDLHLDRVGRVNTADTVDTIDSAEANVTPTSSAAQHSPSNNANKQPAWLEALEQERKLKKDAQGTGKAAEKLLADTIRHSESARRRSGFGLFAPTWGATQKGSPGRKSGGGVVSYDRRNLPTMY